MGAGDLHRMRKRNASDCLVLKDKICSLSGKRTSVREKSIDDSITGRITVFDCSRGPSWPSSNLVEGMTGVYRRRRLKRGRSGPENTGCFLPTTSSIRIGHYYTASRFLLDLYSLVLRRYFSVDLCLYQQSFLSPLGDEGYVIPPHRD